MASHLTRVNLFGLPFVSADMGSAIRELLDESQHPKTPKLISAADVHVTMRTVSEPDYGQCLSHFDWIFPDGMPLVWLLKKRRKDGVSERLSGPNIMRELWAASENSSGTRHFLLGGKPETLETLQKNLAELYPNTVLAGTYSPPFGHWDEEEQAHIRHLIRESGATCVWVGLGCPKQERWLSEHKSILPPALYFAVGAAFDFHAGNVRRAPLWMQRHGLEWFYRLCCEPRRLFRRYLKYNSLFLYCLLTGKA